MTDHCRFCGKAGEGSYVREIMVSLFGGNGVTDEMVFYCKTCVEEMARQRELDNELERELMQDPEYAEEARKAEEEHKRLFREALARNVAIH